MRVVKFKSHYDHNTWGLRLEKLKMIFNAQEVKNLDDYQKAHQYHPFTCPNRGDGKHYDNGIDLGGLIPTINGWICQYCDYTQDWAHGFMKEQKNEIGILIIILIVALSGIWCGWQLANLWHDEPVYNLKIDYPTLTNYNPNELFKNIAKQNTSRYSKLEKIEKWRKKDCGCGDDCACRDLNQSEPIRMVRNYGSSDDDCACKANPPHVVCNNCNRVGYKEIQSCPKCHDDNGNFKSVRTNQNGQELWI
jgi:hypothetical protein